MSGILLKNRKNQFDAHMLPFLKRAFYLVYCSAESIPNSGRARNISRSLAAMPGNWYDGSNVCPHWREFAMVFPAAVLVFALHTDTVRGTDLSEMALRMPERMKKAARYRFERDHLLCIGAGLLMLSALGIPDESALVFGAFGKPYAPGYPAFSLSHSGNWCVLARDPDPVGIDLEKPVESALSAAPRVFIPAELAWMSESPTERFFQL